MDADASFWKRCSNCKKELPFAGTYWACNVSTCNRPRTALVFCSVSCWDAHVPTLRHRDAWAEERRSPTAVEWAREQREAERKERRRADRARRSSSSGGDAPDELPGAAAPRSRPLPTTTRPGHARGREPIDDTRASALIASRRRNGGTDRQTSHLVLIVPGQTRYGILECIAKSFGQRLRGRVRRRRSSK